MRTLDIAVWESLDAIGVELHPSEPVPMARVWLEFVVEGVAA